MGIKIISKNKRVGYDFSLSEKFEAGLELTGTEVKSLRAGHCKIAEAHVNIDKHGEVWVYNMHIPKYEYGTYANHDEVRKRKLLLNRKEINELVKGTDQKGFTIVPTMIYFKGSLVKLEIALAKGKKLFDKRHAEAEKSVQKKLRQGNFDI